MRSRWIVVPLIWGIFLAPLCVHASTGDLGTIIERFVVHQFPDAAQHYWIINETQWDGNEMIVDMHTIVQERKRIAPLLSHFLLLIVAGEVKGVQQMPLDPGTDCQPEQET